jgi:antitoxin component YwqK of YwqJK toxin-antitoxin module
LDFVFLFYRQELEKNKKENKIDFLITAMATIKDLISTIASEQTVDDKKFLSFLADVFSACKKYENRNILSASNFKLVRTFYQKVNEFKDKKDEMNGILTSIRREIAMPENYCYLSDSEIQTEIDKENKEYDEAFKKIRLIPPKEWIGEMVNSFINSPSVKDFKNLHKILMARPDSEDIGLKEEDWKGCGTIANCMILCKEINLNDMDLLEQIRNKFFPEDEFKEEKEVEELMNDFLSNPKSVYLLEYLKTIHEKVMKLKHPEKVNLKRWKVWSRNKLGLTNHLFEKWANVFHINEKVWMKFDEIRGKLDIIDEYRISKFIKAPSVEEFKKIHKFLMSIEKDEIVLQKEDWEFLSPISKWISSLPTSDYYNCSDMIRDIKKKFFPENESQDSDNNNQIQPQKVILLEEPENKMDLSILKTMTGNDKRTKKEIKTHNDQRSFISYYVLETGEMDGSYIEFWPHTDIVRLEGELSRGMKQGKWIQRNKEGIITCVQHYKDDKKCGDAFNYNEDGTLSCFVQYNEDGKHHGIYRTYNPIASYYKIDGNNKNLCRNCIPKSTCHHNDSI